MPSYACKKKSRSPHMLNLQPHNPCLSSGTRMRVHSIARRSPVDACWLLVIFFFNDTATTEIYTLSLHDALPIGEGVFDHDVYVVASDGDLEEGVSGEASSRSEEHTSELQSRGHLVCRLLLE